MPDISTILCAIILLAISGLYANDKKGEPEFSEPDSFQTTGCRYYNSQAEPEISAPGTYKLLPNEKFPIRIPFQMLHNKPVMEAKINGKQAFLTIDNGILWDEIWLFGTPLVESLDLETDEENSIEGAGDGESTQAFMAKNLQLSFPEIEFYDQIAYVSPASAGFASAFKGMDGQICNTFFSHFVVEFDFENRVIILHEPDTYQFTGKGCALDIKRESSGTCSLPASYTLENGDVHQGRIDMDLGGVHTVLVALNPQNGIKIPENAIESKLYGASGEFSVFESTIKELQLGSFSVKHPEATFCDENSGRVQPGNIGTVGLPMLMRYNPIFDYRKDMLYLQEREW